MTIWNYVAVHKGALKLGPLDDMHDLFNGQSGYSEAKPAPKRFQTSETMTEGLMEAMMHQSMPWGITVDKIDGTLKLSQNKPNGVRLRAADAVGELGSGQGAAMLAALNRNPEEDHP